MWTPATDVEIDSYESLGIGFRYRTRPLDANGEPKFDILPDDTGDWNTERDERYQLPMLGNEFIVQSEPFLGRSFRDEVEGDYCVLISRTDDPALTPFKAVSIRGELGLEDPSSYTLEAPTYRFRTWRVD